MTTVFDALVAIAERLPRVARGIATGGGEDISEYLYVDDAVRLALNADDTFIGGTLLVESGDCAGAVLTVRDSVQSTGRVSGDQRIWEQGSDETPAAGDIYLVTPGLYGPAQLLLALREALRSWGLVETREEIGTGDGQTTTFWRITEGEIVRVLVVEEDGDPATEYVHWEAIDEGIELSVAPPAASSVQVVVRSPAENGLTLPAQRWTLTENLGEIPIEFLGYYGAYVCLRGALAAPGQDQDGMVQLMNYHLEQADLVRGRTAPNGPARERFMR